METITLRIPPSLARRLTSDQMRSWLADFLRQPHSLPPDPGSGEERVSLTLPREALQQAGGFLYCSPSVALRRIAIERLGGSKTAASGYEPRAPVSGTACPSPGEAGWSPTPGPHWTEVPTSAQDHSPVAKTLAEWLIPVLIWVLAFGGWLFFNFRKGKRTETT